MPVDLPTVVMITRDRRGDLERSLDRLTGLVRRPRIIVVDNASAEPVHQWVPRSFPDVRVIRLDQNLGAAARNIGVAIASSDLVAFADDDSWWLDGALDRAAELLRAHDRIGLLAGRILVGRSELDDPINAVLAGSPLGRRPGHPGPTVLGFAACSAVVRRSAFLESGGFVPRFGVGGEEMLLALRLASRGVACVFASDVVAVHHPSTRRDAEGRDRVVARNELWTEWLARPMPEVLTRSGRHMIGLVRRPAGRAVVVEALGSARWAGAHRQPVPAQVAAAWRLLDRHRGGCIRASRSTSSEKRF